MIMCIYGIIITARRPRYNITPLRRPLCMNKELMEIPEGI